VQHPIIMAPFANECVKEWPLCHFRELAEIIVREHGFAVAVVGTRAQRAAANDLVRGLSSEDVINACGRWSWAELSRAIDAAPYVVANNSGVAHLAASRGRWTLCLFAGSHAVSEWGPRGPNVVTISMRLPCAPCGLGPERCPNGLVCMAEIKPSMVFRRFDEARKRELAADRLAERVERQEIMPGAELAESFGCLTKQDNLNREGVHATPAASTATTHELGETAPGTVLVRSDDGAALPLPCTIDADTMRVHDAYGVGAENRLRADREIFFDARIQGDVAEPALFFGPYLSLEPGRYSFRLVGELVGPLKLRLTQRFATERLLETELNSFAEPILLRLEAPAEKFELIGERTAGTRSMTLRSIVVEAASAGEVGSARSEM
jgi:hypothetical protein